MTTSIYGRAAAIYRNHGWQGVLPLPPEQKAHPPTGYTGATGKDPDQAQIDLWCRTQDEGNIALRLPDGVIGIDVDAYLDKHGDVSLLALQTELGLLPPTWRSSSRGLGKSGIYLFRVPPGRYQDQPAPAIEIIQHHHRYMVVMPSIHPEGRPYLWYDPEGVEQHRPPNIDELPWLPDLWVDYLAVKQRPEQTYEPRAHQVDEWSAAVTRAFTKALMDMPGGRHNAALRGALAIIRLATLEHPGADEAIAELGVRFRAAIADRSSPAQADKEWSDMLAGAGQIVRETPSEAPVWEDRPTFGQADLDDYLRTAGGRRETKGARQANAEVGGLTGRIMFDGDFWNRNREGEQWLISPILALGRSHALYAPAKAGKSLLALEIAAAIASGRPVLDQPAGPPRVVLYADFEMTEDDVYERLVDLGYSEADDLTRFHYHLHPMIGALDTVKGGAALVAHAVLIEAELVVVDTVARTISGPENDADTIRALARFTFTPLKARGITSLRVDHAGKDLTKGQRGTSAKNDDVDIVWQLTVADGEAVTLRATHRRLSWVPETVNLTRTSDPLHHQTVDHMWPAGTAECATRLDDLGVPYGATVVAAQAALKLRGWGTRKAVVNAAMRYRTSGTVSGTVEKLVGNRNPEPSTNSGPDVREPSREPSGTVDPDVGTVGRFSKGTAQVPSPPETQSRLYPDPEEDF